MDMLLRLFVFMTSKAIGIRNNSIMETATTNIASSKTPSQTVDNNNRKASTNVRSSSSSSSNSNNSREEVGRRMINACLHIQIVVVVLLSAVLGVSRIASNHKNYHGKTGF